MPWSLVRRTLHFFLSHFQKEANDMVKALHLTFERLGCSAWLDMDAENLTLGGMRRGVEDSVTPERSAQLSILQNNKRCAAYA